MELIKRLINDEQGQGLTEYALIIGLIALGCVAALVLVGDELNTIWTNITTRLGEASDGTTTP